MLLGFTVELGDTVLDARDLDLGIALGIIRQLELWPAPDKPAIENARIFFVSRIFFLGLFGAGHVELESIDHLDVVALLPVFLDVAV